jgi:hypothetical protein
LPQHFTAPLVVTAHTLLSPTATSDTDDKPTTSTGVEEKVGDEPFPKLPKPPYPQHFTVREVVTTQLDCDPLESDCASSMFKTCVAPLLVVVVPSPN